MLPLLALALFAAGAVIDRSDRRRTALNIGIAMLLVGTLTFAGSLIVRAVVVYGSDGEQRDVVAGVYDAFMGGFVLWAGALALAGAIVAASAASVGGRDRPRRHSRATCGAASRASPTASGRSSPARSRSSSLGVWVIGDPIGAVRFVTVVFGSWLIFAGAVTLLRLAHRPRADRTCRPPRRCGAR